MRTNRYTILRLLTSLILVLAATLVFMYRQTINFNTIESWLVEHAILAPLMFMAVYTLLVPLFFPSTVIALLGGALFGPVWGSLFNQISATLGASLCFFIARYLSSAWLEKILPKNIRRLKQIVEKRGWRFVLTVRLVPWLPFALISYVLGVTQIRLGVLISITSACILPRIIAYSMLGYAGRMALQKEESVAQGLLVTSLVLAMVVLPYLIVRLRGDLKYYLEQPK